MNSSLPGWLRVCAALMILPIVFLLPVQVQAASIFVQNSSLKPDFPNTITFLLSAQSDSPISEVTLVYGVSSDSCLSSQARQEMKFDPGTKVDIHWEWDLTRSGSLPPGVEVWWQWEIHSQDGESLTTEVQKQSIEDPGFQWKQLSKDNVTLYWADGNAGFADRLMNIATSSLQRLTKTVGMTPKNSIRMMIYPSADDMKKALIHISEWAGGVAFPEYDVVLIGIPPGDLAWAESVIPHELAHLVTDMQIFNCQDNYLPSWFNEGLAQYAEGPATDADRVPVLSALKQNNLTPLTSLANGFPADTTMANLAYSHSRLVIAFVIETYGPEKLQAFLEQIRSGEEADAALRAVYGMDTSDLDQAWRASLGFGSAPEPRFVTATPVEKGTAIPTLALSSPLGQPTASSTPTLQPADGAPTASLTPAPSATTTPIQTERMAQLSTPAAPAHTARQGSPQFPLGRAALAAAVVVCLAGLALLFFFVILPKRTRKS